MTSIYQIKANGATVYAKMESENPTGTHKDRSMGPWIDYYIKQGRREFALSSSGNSAVSAARVCEKMGVKLTIFLHPGDKSHRLEDIKESGNIIVELSKTPKKDAFQFSKEHNIPFLRASTDDNALGGYKSIAYELIEQLPEVDNIFIPTSSGATLEGIYLGFVEKSTESDPVDFSTPALYAVQTTKVHPIAGKFDHSFENENKSRASAIVDNIAHRKERLAEIIGGTKGGGLVISNDELSIARNILRQDQELYKSFFDRGEYLRIDKKVSHPEHGRWQSSLAFAGFLKWQSQNPKKAKNEVSVCLFTD